MPKFSKISLRRLETCHPSLQELCQEVIVHVDFSVLCGYRNEEEQEQAVREGKSRVHYPDSKHNQMPSLAVDVAPYPVDWNDPARFARLYGHFERIAFQRRIPIRWGGDWNNNFRTKDERLIDMPHIELVLDP